MTFLLVNLAFAALLGGDDVSRKLNDNAVEIQKLKVKLRDYDPGIFGSPVCNVLAPKGHNHLAREIGERMDKALPAGTFLLVNVKIDPTEKEVYLWRGMLWLTGTREEVTGGLLLQGLRAVGSDQ